MPDPTAEITSPMGVAVRVDWYNLLWLLATVAAGRSGLAGLTKASTDVDVLDVNAINSEAAMQHSSVSLLVMMKFLYKKGIKEKAKGGSSKHNGVDGWVLNY